MRYLTKPLISIFAVLISCSVLGCSGAGPTKEVEMFGQEYPVPVEKEVTVEVKISNCVSRNDGYVYSDSIVTIKGNTATLNEKAKSKEDEYRRAFPDAQFEVLSIDNKEV